jgi:hypothetical protein
MFSQRVFEVVVTNQHVAQVGDRIEEMLSPLLHVGNAFGIPNVEEGKINSRLIIPWHKCQGYGKYDFTNDH